MPQGPLYLKDLASRAAGRSSCFGASCTRQHLGQGAICRQQEQRKRQGLGWTHAASGLGPTARMRDRLHWLWVPAGLQGGPVHRGLWAPLTGPHPKILGLELWPPPMLQAEGGSAPTLRTKQARTQPLIKRV